MGSKTFEHSRINIIYKTEGMFTVQRKYHLQTATEDDGCRDMRHSGQKCQF